MSRTVSLTLGWGRRLPLVMQAEAAECGLACLTMIAGWHGYDTDLGTLRARHALSANGARLDDLMRVSHSLNLSPRALRTEPTDFDSLALPCVVHVDFNHFVVLHRVRRTARGLRFDLHDPASGRQRWAMEEMSRRFTGVVLELHPGETFKPAKATRRASLRALAGRLPGLARGVGQALGLALALEVFVLAAPFYMQWVIDDVVVSADRDLLVVLALGFGLLVLFQTLVAALRGYVLAVLGVHVNLALTRRLFTHLLRLPMRFFSARSVGDLQARFGSLDAIAGTLTGGALGAVMDGVMCMATFTLMWLFSPLLTAIVLGTAALYAALRFALFGPLRRASEEQIVRGAKRDTHFLETLRGMQSIKLFGAERVRNATFANLAVAEFNAGLRMQRLNQLYGALNGLLFGLCNLGVVAVAAHLVIASEFSVGMLLAFMAYKGQFVGRIAALIDTAVSFAMLNLHRERVGDIALAEPDSEPVDIAGDERGVMPRGYAISFEQVGFRYGENAPPTLHNATMTVNEGESVAVVGPSGCGKSTLLKVVLGLLRPTTGEVRIGGVAVERLPSAWRQSNIGAVMQDDHLFAGSLYDNIAFFDTDVDRNRVEECARIAAVDEDIRLLPMGYHTLVGDMGSTLSGGQKQRLLLARALYRRPRILILDEATSHLDVANERLVTEALRKLGITTLTVAHRPETIASADRVVQLAGANAGTAAGRAFLAA